MIVVSLIAIDDIIKDHYIVHLKLILYCMLTNWNLSKNFKKEEEEWGWFLWTDIKWFPGSIVKLKKKKTPM